MHHTLVFIHGWLGSVSDWDGVISHLKHPGDIINISLEEIEKLDAMEIKNPLLIGYSMGGRIALGLHKKNPAKFPYAIILGGHLGLSVEEKPAQIAREEAILEEIKMLPFESFIRKWYSQPLFNTLSISEEFIKQRASGDPQKAAQLFASHRLSTQPLFSPSEKSFFLAGSHDLKYQNLYAASIDAKNRREIPGAGHAAHIEAPQATASAIEQLVKRISEDDNPDRRVAER